MAIIINWFLSALAIVVASYILSGVHVENFVTALIVAVVLGIINAVIKPVIVILTLPINILTLGLFTLVINAALVMLTSAIVPGFQVDGFLWALVFSVLLSLVNIILDKVK